jgi:hypothetical protein
MRRLAVTIAAAVVIPVEVMDVIDIRLQQNILPVL